VNLIELFQPSLKGRREKPALIYGEQTYTFGDLDAKSDAIAWALKKRFNIRKGDRLSMFIGNCPELVLYYLAAHKLGAIVVPFNTLYRDHELSYLLEDASPRVLLTDRERHEILKPLKPKLGFIEAIYLVDAPATAETLCFSELLADAAPPFDFGHVSGDDGALMIYTSGTTGRSKGALLSHHALASNIVALLHCWQWTERDRFLLALPMFHLHGLGNGLHGAMASGCTTFLLPKFKAEDVLQVLNQRECTLFFGVPTMYERMLEAAAKGATVPTNMRLYVSGSAPLSVDTFSRFREVFKHEILERYGMSETAMITSNPYSGVRKQGSVGKPLPGIQVRIATPEGTVAAPGEVGEIQVKGPNLLKEYWKQPEKTAEAYQDGWFKTGDLGFCDTDGYISISGRGKELIISGGFNVYPQEIINCLCNHPDIVEAAVIGVPDKTHGELVKAYVVSKSSSLTPDAVIDYCKSHLARFKVPKSVRFLEKLPRNAMGKLLLKELPDRERI